MRTRSLSLDVAPWTLFRALARKERPFFIDAGQPWGDEWVSSMGFRPRMQLRIAAGDGNAGAALDELDTLLAPLAPAAAPRADRPLPFASGAVVALAYETKNAIERLPQTQVEAPDAPHLVAAIYDAVVAYDHRRRTYRVATWHLDDAALMRFAEEIADAAADFLHTRPAVPFAGALTERHADPRDARLATRPLPITSTFHPEEYAEHVERVRAYIAAGDVYQVNLSMRLRAPLLGSPLDMYGRLRAAQPVPFGGYFDLGHEQVLSNSPELFLRRRGTRVETCPIKGTRRRGGSAEEDARLIRELERDPKEQAEHVMIVDLERNDLGRVCRTGTVRVTRFAEPTTFHTLHHLVSTVRGSLPPGMGTADLLRATFPGGSITGAPKIRAMQIIDEVERGPRGFYTGALGWIDTSGDLDLNVAIRTAVARDDALAYHVGSGIVADSDARREHAECLLKAEAFFRALEVDAAPSPTVAAAATAGDPRG